MTSRTKARLPIERILRPFQEFARLEASGGIVLLLCTLIALAWANSPWAESYWHLWETEITIHVGRFEFSRPLHFWINDGLMVIFFLLVGLEIKREFLVGELSSSRKAALPVFAALGGMVAPALIYAAFNRGQATIRGWGIPMATDIAFSLGILALLGRRVPLGLKVFLAAFAIADDLGAVVVIALFYTGGISWTYLLYGAGFLLALAVANWSGVRSLLVYSLLGMGLWWSFLLSGVHPTVAGVLLALTIPARTKIDAEEFLRQGRALLAEFEASSRDGRGILTNEGQQSALHALEEACELVETPLQKMEEGLHSWVAFGIMPLFALANAGVTVRGENVVSALQDPVTLGVLAGLVLGKQTGITLFSWLAVRTGLAALPASVTWRHIYGVGWLGGIGFTMSLFIAHLAFGSSPELASAKAGILVASVLSGLGGTVILRATRAEPAESP